MHVASGSRRIDASTARFGAQQRGEGSQGLDQIKNKPGACRLVTVSSHRRKEEV